MPNKKLGKSKNDYQSMLWTYLQRKEKMKDKYLGTVYYATSVFKINKKIAVLRKAIKRIEKKELFMHSVREKIIDFNGIDVRRLPHKIFKKERINTRKSFYKYCMENGVRGNEIAAFLGFKHASSITRKRLEFTRSFKIDKENLNFWHSFVKHMKREN